MGLYCRLLLATTLLCLNFTNTYAYTTTDQYIFVEDLTVNVNQGETVNAKVIGYTFGLDSIFFGNYSPYQDKGILSFLYDGSFSYTAYENESGPIHFDFYACDLYACSDDKTVTININSRPYANTQEFSVDLEGTLTQILYGEDKETPQNQLEYYLTEDTYVYGDLQLSQDGYFVFNPYWSGKTTFKYVVFDGLAYSEPVTVNIYVTEYFNAAPVAHDDNFTTYSSETLKAYVFAEDEDDDALTYELVSDTADGYLYFKDDGSFEFLPYYTGATSFSYRVWDGEDYSNTATVVIDVTEQNSIPTAFDDSFEILANKELNSYADAYDPEDDPLSFTLLTGPSNGSLFFDENGYFDYLPSLNWTGTDSFTFDVTDDGEYYSNIGEVSIYVWAPLPEISDIDDVSINENSENNEVRFSITNEGQLVNDVQISINSSNLSLISNDQIYIEADETNYYLLITPKFEQSGSATITVSVNDGINTSKRAFLVTVLPVNDPPTITPIANQFINENSDEIEIQFDVYDTESRYDLDVTFSSSNQELFPNEYCELVDLGNGYYSLYMYPEYAKFGKSTFTVRVSDGVTTTTSTFEVTVADVDFAPVIEDIPNQTLEEDTLAHKINVTVYDPDDDLMYIKITTDNAELLPTLDDDWTQSASDLDNDLISLPIIPASNLYGTAKVIVEASDEFYEKVTTKEFMVEVTSVNDRPVITAITDKTILENSENNLIFFSITDPDSTSFNATVTSSNQELFKNQNIVVTKGQEADKNYYIELNPEKNRSGEAQITIAIKDEREHPIVQTINILVEPIGQIPTLSLIGSNYLELNLGETYNEPGFVATDAHNNDISSEVQVSSNLNAFMPGNYQVTYTVGDAKATRYILVRGPLLLSFGNSADIYSGVPTNLFALDPISGNSSSADVSWEFENGDVLTGNNVPYTPNGVGPQNVTLSATQGDQSVEHTFEIDVQKPECSIEGKIFGTNQDESVKIYVQSQSQSISRAVNVKGLNEGSNDVIEFKIDNLPPATDYKLSWHSKTRLSGYRKEAPSEIAKSPVRWSEAYEYDLTAECNLKNVDIEVTEGKQLTVNIYNFIYNDKTVNVFIHSPTKPSFVSKDIKLTMGTNIVVLEGLQNSDDYKLMVKATGDSTDSTHEESEFVPGYYSTNGNLRPNLQAATPIKVTDNPQDIDVYFREGGTISGTIYNLPVGQKAYLSVWSKKTSQGVKKEVIGNGEVTVFAISGLPKFSDFTVCINETAEMISGCYAGKDKELVDIGQAVHIDLTEFVASGVDMTLNPGKTASGVITNIPQGDVVNLRFASKTSSNQKVVSVKSSNPQFYIEGLKDSSYIVTISGEYVQSIPEELTLDEDNTTNLEFSIAPGGSISGFVDSLAKGEAVSVTAYSASSNIYKEVVIQAADDDDATFYELNGLPPADDYRVHVKTTKGTFYYTGNDEDTSSLMSNDAIDLAVAVDAYIEDINLFVETIGTLIIGDVQGVEGDYSRKTVTVTLWNNNGYFTKDTRYGNGLIELSNIPEGEYYLAVSATGCPSQFSKPGSNGNVLEWTHSWSDAGPVAISGSLVELEIPLTEGVSVSGSVKYLGESTPNAQVTIYSPSSPGIGGNTTSRADGSYTIDGLLPGNDFNLQAQDFQQGVRSEVVSLSADDDSKVDLELIDKPGSLKGAITNLGDKTAMISLFSIDDKHIQATFVQGDNKFLFRERLDLGSYIIKIDIMDSGEFSASSDTKVLEVQVDGESTIIIDINNL